MSQKKNFVIKCDSETTGLGNNLDQMLTYAYIVKNENDEVVEKKEYKIKLKSGVKPSPMAIYTNKINPFTKAYQQSAVTENEFVNDFEKVLKKYTFKDEAGRTKLPQFESYNVPFDKGFLATAFARSGKKLNEVMSRSSIDPLKTVRKMIQRYEEEIKNPNAKPKHQEFFEKLRNKQDASTFGKSRGSLFSAKLESVAKALDITYGGTGAHSAAADCEVLDKVGTAVFKMATGMDRKNVSTDPASFEVGKVYSILSDSVSSGIKSRHVRVIKNDFEKGQIVVLDEDDIKKNKELKDSAVRTFNYDTVIGESSIDPGSEVSLNAYYNTQKDTIDRWAEAAGAKGRKSDDIFDEDTKHFGLIKAVSDRMSGAKDKKAEFDKCYNDMIEKFNGDRLSAKSVMTKAERLAEAEGKLGWSEDLFPVKTVSMLEKKVGDNTLRVALLPSGSYKFYLDYKTNGETFNNIDEAKGKPELKKLIKERLGDLAGFEDFIKDLPSGSEFSNPKDANSLSNDLKKALEQLKVKPDPATAEALSSLILFLKDKEPEKFKDFKPPVISEYYKIEGEVLAPVTSTVSADGVNKGESVHESMKKFDSMPKVAPVDEDHVPKGQKASKTPCSLCGRPLSASISKEFTMGPTCREKAELLDLSDEPIENYVTEMKPLEQNKKAILPGDLNAIKFRKHDGSESTVYSISLETKEDAVKILDRRKYQKMLKEGLDPAMCTYASTLKINKKDILAIGKIDSEKVSALRKAA